MKSNLNRSFWRKANANRKVNTWRQNNRSKKYGKRFAISAVAAAAMFALICAVVFTNGANISPNYECGENLDNENQYDASQTSKSAYACYNFSNASAKAGNETVESNYLVFYYDTNKASWPQDTCTCLDMNSDTAEPGWLQYNNSCSNIYFDNSFAEYEPTSCYKWFNGFTSIKNSPITDIDANEAYINGSSNSNKNKSQSTINFDNLNTSSITTTESMFENCTSLCAIDLSNLDIANVNTMQNMFKGCTSLTNIWMPNSDTSNLNNTNSMFADCSSLNSIAWNSNLDSAQNIVDDQDMFANCTNLPHWTTDYKTTGKTYAVQDTDGQHGFFVSNNTEKTSSDGADNDNPTNSGTPYVCYNNTTSAIKLPESLGSYELQPNNLVFFCDGKMPYWVLYGANCYAMNTSEDPLWQTHSTNCTNIIFDQSFGENFAVNTCYKWFKNFWNVAGELDCRNLKLKTEGEHSDYSRSFQEMFYNCTKLTSIKFSENFNTSDFEDMSSMFYGCSQLTSLTLPSEFTPTKVTNTQEMFCGCSSLTALTISSFTIDKMAALTNTKLMFGGCSKLTTITCDGDWSSLGTLTSSKYMFTGCSKLPNFDSKSTDKTNAKPSSSGGYFTATA